MMTESESSFYRMKDLADEIDRSTWMICPYCKGNAQLLKRKDSGRHCPQCDRFILPLIESNKWAEFCKEQLLNVKLMK